MPAGGRLGRGPDDLLEPAARRKEGAGERGEPEKYYPTNVRTYALQGYEAMRVALDAIRAAGPRGNDRAAVVAAFHAIRDRDSVLGRYSIDANGDTTLSTYGVVAVGARGRLVYDRTVDSSR